MHFTPNPLPSVTPWKYVTPWKLIQKKTIRFICPQVVADIGGTPKRLGPPQIQNLILGGGANHAHISKIAENV